MPKAAHRMASAAIVSLLPWKGKRKERKTEITLT
jgi:hypothetical protein